VVFRAFAAETIMLNLQTGTYHGLNPTAGRMLETLQQHEVIADAASAIAKLYKQDQESVQADLLVLCSGLVERGLLSVKTDA
jgi:uroporphyrinogen-III decarboxylase